MDISQVGRVAGMEELKLGLIGGQLVSQVRSKVIYCNSVGRVKKLAGQLDCDGNHHHSSEKERM